MKEIINIEDKTISIEITEKDKNAPVVLLVTGTSGGAFDKKYDSWKEFFFNSGFNFVRFNFSEYEEGGSLNKASLSSNKVELKAVISYLKIKGFSLVDNTIILPKSFGMTRSLFAIAKRYIKAIIALSPALSAKETGKINALASTNYGDIKSIFDVYFAKSDLEKFDMPICVIHGDKDKVVPVEGIDEIFDLFPNENNEINVIEGAEHNTDSVEWQKASQIIVKEFLESTNI